MGAATRAEALAALRHFVRHRLPVFGPYEDAMLSGTVQARCLSTVLGGLRERGWVHHIPRLVVLGNHAMQNGFSPAELVDRVHVSFVDGYDRVMLANVVGMSQWPMAIKPYAAGGAYIDRMSDLCGSCRYHPKDHLQAQAAGALFLHG